MKQLQRLKEKRENGAVKEALAGLKLRPVAKKTSCRDLEAVRAYATLGEICDTLREVFGEYTAVSTL